MPTIAPQIAEVAQLMGDPGRANILSILMDGRALTASELAAVAGVTAQTASSHLAKLVERELLTVEKRGPRRSAGNATCRPDARRPYERRSDRSAQVSTTVENRQRDAASANLLRSSSRGAWRRAYRRDGRTWVSRS